MKVSMWRSITSLLTANSAASSEIPRLLAMVEASAIIMAADYTLSPPGDLNPATEEGEQSAMIESHATLAQ